MTRLKSRILLADDHALVLRGLRHILDEQPDLEVTGEARDGAEAVQLAISEEFDLAILDISMPRMTGLQATHELHKRRPRLPILILTMHENEHYLEEALRAGASGYVVKKVADRELVEACRAVLRGERFPYHGAPTPVIATAISRTRRGEPIPRALTPRETEIVKLIAEGYTNKQIAETLVISSKTVDRHRANILQKLGLHDRVEVTRYAIRNGLAQP
jgi:DNA-binding NarL/FixJ family response regulator